MIEMATELRELTPANGGGKRMFGKSEGRKEFRGPAIRC